MEGLDLKRYTALDVFEAEIAGCGVAGLYDVKEMAVGVRVKESERGCSLPVRKEVGVELYAWVAFDPRKRRVAAQVEVIFGG